MAAPPSFAFHTPSTFFAPAPLWSTATSLPCARFCSHSSPLNRSARGPIPLPLRTLESWRAFTRGHHMRTIAVSSSAVVKEREDVGVSTVIKRRKNVLHFVKYHGLGNDFLLVDNRGYMEPKISPEQAIKLCSRKFGIGADGVIFVLPGIDGSDYSMRIFNSDGSEPEMCGNGIRCMAHFVAELENTVKPCSYNIHTAAGPIISRLQEDGQVMVDMGPPFLKAADVPTKLLPSKNGAVVRVPLAVNGKTWMVTCVSMGNPHCVTFGEQDGEVLDVDSLPLEHIGPLFEHHPVFPARTNTEFVQVISPSHLRMRVWERGAGATLACGTGACAVVVAAVLEGRAKKECIIDLPGGQLEIQWMQNDHLYMTGPAVAVCEGDAFL